MPITASSLLRELKKTGNVARAKHAQRYFKAGKGEYGAGDVFLGISMPLLRTKARESQDLTLAETDVLLNSRYHEARMLALLILVQKFQHGDTDLQEQVVALYLRRTNLVNNWDLVDVSAHLILGPWLWRRNKKILETLARSTSLWERRIAILTTFHFIRRGKFNPTLNIARILLDDGQDLIHKAVGWMLREVGNRNRQVEEIFLARRYQRMPRTMLRYAIEKFPEARRQAYLKGRV